MRFLVFLKESFLIAFTMFRSYKLRSTLTTLGIVIGIVVVVVIVAVIIGLNKYVSGELSALGTSTLYVDRHPWIITSEEQWLKVQKRKRITYRQAEMVADLADFGAIVAPTIFTSRTVQAGNKSLERVFVIGTSEEYTETSNRLPSEGRFLTGNDVSRNRNVCVIGSEVAEKLFEDQHPIGKRLRIGGRAFSVVGILEEKGNFFGQSMDTQVIIPIRSFFKAFGSRRSVDIEVKVADPSQMDEAKEALTGILRRVRRLRPTQPDDFAINEQSTLTQMYENSTRVMWIAMVGVGSIALFVGGVGIMNIMLVSVTERTREIGIRKAMGARRGDLILQFLIEAMMVCALGVFIGILISVGVVLLIKANTPLPADISAWMFFLGVGFVLVLGLTFGIYPAYKASQLDPIEALRYE